MSYKGIKKLRDAVKDLEFFKNKNEKPYVILTSPTSGKNLQ